MIKPKIFESAKVLHKAAADYFLSCYKNAVTEHGDFHIALSGGGTPRALYQLLAEEPYKSAIDWQKVHCYFGDERFVAHDHQDSNFKMATEALLSHVDFNENHIHAVPTELSDAKTAAEAYENTLKKHLPKNSDQQLSFDLVLLGLGTDGHTASLFPDTTALTEEQALCVAVYVEKMQSWRVTITFPVINQAKHILLLSESVTKADIIKSLSEWTDPTPGYPIQRVNPQFEMCWYIDNAAGMFL